MRKRRKTYVGYGYAVELKHLLVVVEVLEENHASSRGHGSYLGVIILQRVIQKRGRIIAFFRSITQCSHQINQFIH